MGRRGGMKLFSAMFDMALLPLSLAQDLVNPFPVLVDDEKSKTRERIEQIEKELGM